MKKIMLVFFCVLFLSPVIATAETPKFIMLASTIGPVDAGIIGLLEDEFEKETGIRVRHVGAGTGETLKIAQQGTIDLVLVHAKALEEKFVKEGFGTGRIDLMYNDFVIVGPADDPAGIKGMKDSVAAMKKLADKKAAFITRGDRSGTHIKELEMWEKAGIKPAGEWYAVYEKGSEGNGPTLKFTDQKKAYTIIDRATFLVLKKDIKLVALVENDEPLLNFITLIPVNPAKFPRVNSTDVLTFVNWLTAPEKGQKTIKSFGVEKYGTPLFFPNSEQWKRLNLK